MNERIRELLEKHGFIHDGMTVGEKNDAFKKFERFAEVIAQECAGIVENAVVHREPASTYVGKIREHFGIEE